jgi:magnesium chelatase subunit D
MGGVAVTALPFSAVVGQDDAKLALLLAAIQPRLGGVLLRGHKGSAKTTLARGFAALLPGDAPFVELPLGATEDRVLGSIDLSELLGQGKVHHRPGLLAAADGGVLYVDEINLLADHLVDSLLDVAVSGVNRIEREGVSHSHPARFVLVASMNPEEGELRPQLLDRFGLAVDIETSLDAAERIAAVSAQLAADADPASLSAALDADAALRVALASAVSASVPDDVIELATRVALAVGAEGLRADLMLCRAAAALAGWERRGIATDDDVRRVAPFVLAHRRRRTPFEDPGLTDHELDDAFRAPEPEPDDSRDPTRGDEEQQHAPDPAGAPRLPPVRASGATPGRRTQASGSRGRFVRDVAASPDASSIAAVPSAVSVATRRVAQPDAAVRAEDLRAAVRESPVGCLVVLVVDASGSMGAQKRIATAKGLALALLTDAYQHRDRVALVTFRDEGADVVLRPTGSVEIARARLTELTTGGTTPLAAGLDAARELARRATRDQGLEPLFVVLTDGRATVGGDDPIATSHAAARRIAAYGSPALVVDMEAGPVRLGLAPQLATHLGGDCITADALDAATVARFRPDRRRS